MGLRGRASMGSTCSGVFCRARPSVLQCSASACRESERPRRGHDRRAHPLPRATVRQADHGHVDHVGMPEEHIFVSNAEMFSA